VIGTIAAGILIGIMLSRFFSGMIAGAFGWRAIYVGAAALNVLFAVWLTVKVPADRPRPALPYAKLLPSIAATVVSSRPVQLTLVLSACSFAVFTMFWTGLTFLLSAEPFSYSVSGIGLVNLVGLIGAFAAQPAGRLHDRGWSTRGTGAPAEAERWDMGARIRDVAVGPDGAVWVIEDGRGGKLLRITPRGQ
jgi:predicted MFS family arabinose efflux permease